MLSDNLIAWLHTAPRKEAWASYVKIWERQQWPIIANLGRRDRFFLLTWLLGRTDANHDWIYARCREVEAEPEGWLDLWAREHYKSTLITFAGIIQEILRNPEITITIFSHNQKHARKFLAQIKYEFESNRHLLAAYPEVLWRNPGKQAPRWSVDRGITMQRKSNPRESTVEAYGLVDGLPTGSHARLLVYDDVVTEESVTSPEMIQKTTDQWALSTNLGTVGGRSWYIGTRYHFNDTYREILERKVVRERRHSATKDGTRNGEPVLITREALEEKWGMQGPYIFSCQMMLDPVADEAQGFKREWLKYYKKTDGSGMNRYILCDPASEKKKSCDYSVFMAIGLADDHCYYILDMVRGRFNLTERADTLFRLHRKWRPRAVGYEKYGKDSDIEYYQERMRNENYHFGIIPLGGQVRKEDRIRRLVPRFEQGEVFLPERFEYVDSEGRKHDLTRDFVEEEYVGFPVARHDDMLDCLARAFDPDFPTSWPAGAIVPLEPEKKVRYQKKPRYPGRTWMSA